MQLYLRLLFASNRRPRKGQNRLRGSIHVETVKTHEVEASVSPNLLRCNRLGTSQTVPTNIGNRKLNPRRRFSWALDKLRNNNLTSVAEVRSGYAALSSNPKRTFC